MHFSSFSATLLCTAGRILLGYLLSPSLRLFWWPPHLPLDATFSSRKKLHGQDVVNREVVPLRWGSSRPGTAGCSAHLVSLLFRHALFHVSLTCSHSYTQPIIVTHHLAYPLDVYISPACWKPPAPIVIFHHLTPFFEPLLPLKNTCVWHSFISTNIAETF